MPMPVAIERNKTLERKAHMLLALVPVKPGQRWKVRTDTGNGVMNHFRKGKADVAAILFLEQIHVFGWDLVPDLLLCRRKGFVGQRRLKIWQVSWNPPNPVCGCAHEKRYCHATSYCRAGAHPIRLWRQCAH